MIWQYLIFSFATGGGCGGGGTCTLSDPEVPTDTIVFGFNDTGSNDDDHDDIMIIGRIISSTNELPTPIPGALPLFGSVLGGALVLLGSHRKRKPKLSCGHMVLLCWTEAPPGRK